MRQRRALAFTPSHTDLGEILAAARLAEELGYEMVCVPEGWGHDSTLVLGAVAAQTSSIKIAPMILSVWGRTAATLAMSAVTLQELSNGRLILGLGASTQALVEGFHDRSFKHPAAQLRETTLAVRTLLDGGRVTPTTDTDARPLRLGVRPSSPVPIWHGTVGTLSRRITAETADGWCPAWISRTAVKQMTRQMADVRTATDPKADPLEVMAGPMVTVDSDRDAALAASGATIAWYLCSMGDLHPQFIASQGYSDEVRAVQNANPRLTPSTGIIPPEAAALLDGFTASGPADEVRERLQAWDEVVDIVSIGAPPPGSPWPQVEEAIRAGAPQS